MKLLLDKIVREKIKLIFYKGRELEVIYKDDLDKFVLHDDELKITVEGKEMYDIIGKYSDYVYMKYKKYHNIDTYNSTNTDRYIHEKINSILKSQ